MKGIGLTSVTFRKRSAAEIVELASSCGLTAIEWGADVHARPNDTDALSEIIRLTEKSCVKSCSYGSYYRAAARNEFGFDEVLVAAATLKVPCIRIWAGSTGSADTKPEEFAALVGDLKTITGKAAEREIIIALEFHRGTYADTAESVLKLITECPGLRTYWQENPQIAFEENLRELEALLPYIVNVHVFNLDADLNRYPLNGGADRWREYARTIAKVGASINMLLEFVKDDDALHFGEDAETLKRIIGTRSEL